MGTLDDSAELGSMASALRELASAPVELLVRGTVIDEQYRIERVLGHGAMGVVYLARDLRLAREVALKIARERSAVALARSSREAVALARLSHPNVVVIHQVGEIDGRVYAAMEYVAGQTARGWSEDEHGLREILELYISVGEGLAAAHAAGVVHRDFKPDNVLVGADGRARVADFGLARAPALADPDSPPAIGDPMATGTIAGTPAYMAPEQYRGEDIDARADQFAFCASLWEALHRTRPFAGATPQTICAAIETTEPTRGEPERARRIPRHVELALRRGLAADRDARWPSLPPLLAELRRDPVRRRRRIAIGIGAPVIATIAIVLASRGSRQASVDPCDGGPARIAKAWSPERSARVQAAIAPAGAKAWISRIAAATAAAADDWSSRWAAQYRLVCEATAWSPPLRDRGMNCLARASNAFDATLENLGEPGIAPARVDGLLSHLPRPEPCADPAYLEAIVAPPTDPALAQQVAAVQKELTRVKVLAAAGMHDRAVALWTTVAAGPPLDFPPLGAEIQHAKAIIARWHGDDEDAFGELRDAYFAARTVGERVIAADAASEATLALLNLSRDADAAQWAQLAEVEVSTIADPSLQARTLHTLAIVANDRNEPARGLELASRSIAIARRLHVDQHITDTLLVRSTSYDLLGSYDLALADLKEAAITTRATSGEIVPKLSVIEQASTMVLVHMGKIEDGVAAARRGLAIAEQLNDPDALNNAIGSLGMALTHARQFAEALVLIDRSLATNRKLDGERSYNVASDLNNRCDLLTQMRRFPEAIADGRLAAEIFAEVVGKDASEIGAAAYNVANAELSAGRFEDARATSDRAVAILAKQADNPAQAPALIVRAVATAHRRDLAGARADLERAIAVLTRRPSNPTWLAWARLELAKLEVESGHPAAGRPLAIAARDAFRTAGDPRLDEAEHVLAGIGQ